MNPAQRYTESEYLLEVKDDVGVELIDTQGLQGPPGIRVVNVQTVTTTGPTLSIDWEDGELVRLTLSHDLTAITVTNWPPAGYLAKLTFEITNPNGHAISDDAWPSDPYWSESFAPNVSTNFNVIAFTTTDGGVTVFGHIIGTNFQRVTNG